MASRQCATCRPVYTTGGGPAGGSRAPSGGRAGRRLLPARQQLARVAGGGRAALHPEGARTREGLQVPVTCPHMAPVRPAWLRRRRGEPCVVCSPVHAAQAPMTASVRGVAGGSSFTSAAPCPPGLQAAPASRATNLAAKLSAAQGDWLFESCAMPQGAAWHALRAQELFCSRQALRPPAFVHWRSLQKVIGPPAPSVWRCSRQTPQQPQHAECRTGAWELPHCQSLACQGVSSLWTPSPQHVPSLQDTPQGLTLSA
jgi:hypothetical protein